MKRLVRILLIALAVSAVWWFLAPGEPTGPRPFLGYVEADSIFVAPKAGGRLVSLRAEEGESVQAGDELFALDSETETAAVASAEARLAQAKAELAGLKVPRQRPPEIAALEAKREQALASAELSKAELERQQRLYEERTAPEARLDQARTAYRRDIAGVTEVARQIEAANLPGRDEEIAAAEANVEASRAALDQARSALADRSVAVPEGGRVLDLLYRIGEMVPAGQPVAEILPPANLLVRFYVPEAELAHLGQGDRVAISCDGCPPDLSGRISFVASEAEFTPPVIFSREERSKLVFRLEAKPDDGAEALKPGLPVEVRPL